MSFALHGKDMLRVTCSSCRLCSLLPSFYCVRSICLYIHAQHNLREFQRAKIRLPYKLSLSAKQNVYKRFKRVLSAFPYPCTLPLVCRLLGAIPHTIVSV